MFDIKLNDTVILLIKPEYNKSFKVTHIAPSGVFIENNEMSLCVDIKYLRMIN